MSRLISEDGYKCPYCNKVGNPVKFQYKNLDEIDPGCHHTKAVLMGCRNCHKVFWDYYKYRIQ